MLNNIKSIYIMENILEKITYIKKLNLAKYNKAISDRLDIKLEDYKNEFYKIFKITFKVEINTVNIDEIKLNKKNIDDKKLEFLCKIGFDSLKALYLNDNKIINIQPLKEACFKRIKYLNLSSNQILNIES